MEDVTARRQLELDLTYQATRDALTGLANRTVLVDRIEQALARLVPGRALTVLFADIDGFKGVGLST